MTNKLKIVAVIGNANIDDSKHKQQLAFEIGKKIIDNGYLLVTGGMGGVMEYASHGAQSSTAYRNGSVIAFLPHSKTQANSFVDIAIPTGLGLVRNNILISSADAVITIGGGSGTLNEISTAWQMNKLIISLKSDGWSENLRGIALDSRRDDIIYSALNPSQALDLLNEKIDLYTLIEFNGVSTTSMSEVKAKLLIEGFFSTNGLTFLGKGNEGAVFKDVTHIYKIIYEDPKPLHLYWQLLALSSVESQCIPSFEVFMDKSKGNIFIKSMYIESNEINTNISTSAAIHFLNEMKKVSWVVHDIKLENFRQTSTDVLLYIDLGHSFIPYSKVMFECMSRRIFLLTKFSQEPNIKKYLTETNESGVFHTLHEIGLDPMSVQKEYQLFCKMI